MTAKKGKQINRLLSSLLILVFALLITCSCAYANEANPTIKLTASDGDERIANMGFDMFRIAEIDMLGNIQPLPPFEDFNVNENLINGTMDDLAKSVSEYCESNELTPDTSLVTNRNGTASGSLEKNRYYLVVGRDLKTENAVYSSLPFIVSVPHYDSETQQTVFDVSAFPKISKTEIVAPTPTPEPTPTPTPSVPPSPGPTPTPPTPPDDKLPQTGVLWWPIPVFLILGVSLISVGLLKSGIKIKTIAIFMSVFLGLILLAAAVLLTAYNMLDDMRAARVSREEGSAIMAAILSDTSANKDVGEGDEEYKYMPIKTIDGVDYVAMLYIPKLELELPVRSETTYPGLDKSPCLYSGSAYMNDLVICAHNYSQHFGRIKNLWKDDDVMICDMDGNMFYYKVSHVEILSPYSVEAVKNSEYDLTLTTCTIGGARRVVVRCFAADEGT